MPPCIKICGITEQKTATLITEKEVDFAGFIFHAPSVRNVTPQQARQIKTGPHVKRVGVFVKQSLSQIQEIMAIAGLHMAQLCNDPDVQFCSALGPDKIIKVFWPDRYEHTKDLETDLKHYAGTIKYALLDSGKSGGGHGQLQDLDFLERLRSPVPWLLAGGLSCENLPDVMKRCNPVGYDLNSALESEPGKKDNNKIKLAVKILKEEKKASGSLRGKPF